MASLKNGGKTSLLAGTFCLAFEFLRSLNKNKSEVKLETKSHFELEKSKPWGVLSFISLDQNNSVNLM